MRSRFCFHTMQRTIIQSHTSAARHQKRASMPAISNPVLFDIPEQIETERLMLRAPQPHTGAIIHRSIHNSLDTLIPWSPWAYDPPSVDQCEEHERRVRAKFILRESLPYVAFLKDTGDHVGNIGFVKTVWSVPYFEVGYWVASAHQRKGYASEAVIALTDMAFRVMQAERVQLQCDVLNVASASVARRCGFTLEGTIRCDMREPDGRVSSAFMFSIVRSEWEARQP
jgi:ribosomal-protein-serine acetyltransferase